jgi:DNA polymerase III epsilon subunit-like protein
MRSPRWTAIDVETTGGSKEDRIIQVAVVSFSHGYPISSWALYIKPEPWRDSHFYAQKTHNIPKDLLKRAPAFSMAVLDRLTPYLKNRTVVAHNASTEIRFLKYEVDRLKAGFDGGLEDKDLGWVDHIEWACTSQLTRKLYKCSKAPNLKETCSFLDVELITHHDALFDAKACGMVFGRLRDAAGTSEKERLRYKHETSPAFGEKRSRE